MVARDPVAVLPLCGCDVGSCLGHWLEMAARVPDPPKVFLVNWFRKDADGKFMWPGFGENMRVLEWIIARSTGAAGAVETPVGWAPRPADLDLPAIDVSPATPRHLLGVALAEWSERLGVH